MGGGGGGNPEDEKIGVFGDDLVRPVTKAPADANGQGPAVVHAPIAPRPRLPAGNCGNPPSDAGAKGPLKRLRPSDFRKRNQRQRRASDRAAALSRRSRKSPKRALVA